MTRRPNILFLAHRVPYPPNRGDRIRSFHLLKFLADRGDVSLATLADEPLEAGTHEVLAGLCRRMAIEPLGKSRWLRAALSLARGNSATEGLFHSPRLRQTILSWRQQARFDAVVVFCSSMVQYLDAADVPVSRTIVDLCDVDSQKFLDYAAHARGLKKRLYALEAARLRRLECSLPGRAGAITLVSEAEAELFRGFCPNRVTHAVTNGVDLDYYLPPRGDGRSGRCVFVGAMDYQPNIDGMIWFCRNVWPHVRAARPDASLVIVGRAPTPSVRSLGELPGVEVTGPVPDIRPYLADAQVAVVPLLIARGVQNKVLEAMAMARPVLASPQALEGLNVTRCQHVLCASDSADWVSRLCRLFDDKSERLRVGAAGRQYVEQEHGWEPCLLAFESLLDRTGAVASYSHTTTGACESP